MHTTHRRTQSEQATVRDKFYTEVTLNANSILLHDEVFIYSGVVGNNLQNTWILQGTLFK